jgi:hypothetical protein
MLPDSVYTVDSMEDIYTITSPEITGQCDCDGVWWTSHDGCYLEPSESEREKQNIAAPCAECGKAIELSCVADI